MFKFSTMSKSEMPSIALTREQQILLGLEGYSPQTMIAQLVLPVHKPVKTKKVNSFSYRFTKKMCLAVKVVLPGVTPPRDENVDFGATSTGYQPWSATSTPFLQIGVLCGDTASTLVKDEAECNRRPAVDNTQELNSLNKVFLGVDSWDDPTSVGVSPFGMGFVDRDQLMNNAIKPTVQHVVKIDDIKTGETHAAFFGANRSNLLLSVAVANFIGANTVVFFLQRIPSELYLRMFGSNGSWHHIPSAD